MTRTYNPVGMAVGLGASGTAFGAILGNSGKTLLLGPLFDSYATKSQGQQFVANAINFLAAPAATGPVAVPTVSTWGLVLIGMLLAGSAALLMGRKSQSPVA